MARLSDVQSTRPDLVASATLTVETRGEGFIEITGAVADFLRQGVGRRHETRAAR